MWRSFGLFFSLMILFAVGVKGQKCGEPIKLNNGPQLFIGGKFGLEGGLIVTLTVFILIILMYYFQREKIHVPS